MNPIFNPTYYLFSNFDLRTLPLNPWEHYLEFGFQEGRLPNPLFDPIYFRIKHAPELPFDQDPLNYYLNHPEKDWSPHPLFDPTYYRKQLIDPIEGKTLLEHFLDTGWKQGLSPSPFFDPKFYQIKNPDVVIAGANPLLHYLMHGEQEGRPPNPEFFLQEHHKPAHPEHWNSLAVYLRSKLSFYVLLEIQKINLYEFPLKPIKRVVVPKQEAEQEPLEDATYSENTYRLFDANYYQFSNPEVKSDPLDHYLTIGAKEGRFPNLLFDPDYYLSAQKEEVPIEPLKHYVLSGKEGRSPHPLFNDNYYLEQTSKLDIPEGVSLLEHFLIKGSKAGLSPCKSFSPSYYLSENTDVRQKKISPFFHYLLHGEQENRKPSAEFDPSFWLKPFPLNEKEHRLFQYLGKLGLQHRGIKLRPISAIARFQRGIKEMDPIKPVLIAITHDASRTGAPLIILKLAEQFKAFFDLNIVCILCDGGELEVDFENMGPSYLVQDYYRWKESILKPQANTVLDALSDFTVIGALVNSAESREWLPYLKYRKIPTISLVHEMANLYKPKSFQRIAENTDKVVFPSQIVRKLAIENAPFENNKIIVRGQGLLKPKILGMDKEEAKKLLREELDLPLKSKIVLGCGSLSGRKGPDLFVQTGLLALPKLPEDVYFVWLGGGHRHLQDISYWLEIDLKKKGLDHRIQFIGERKVTEHFFVGSDIFYLTSRADPFPCVVHEAMAARTPIVGYEDAGGFSEALAGNSGKLVPYADLSKAAEVICEWVESPEKGLYFASNAFERVNQHYHYSDYTKDLAVQLSELVLEYPELSQSPIAESFLEKVSSSKPEDLSSGKKTARKVIFTVPNWQISGVNTFIERLVEQLISHGYDAFILFTTNYSAGLPEELLPKVPYFFLMNEDEGPGKIWKKLQYYLESNAPCVFIPNHDYVASSISPVLSPKVGVLGILHSDDKEHYEHGYRLGLYWNRIICVSERIRNRMLEYNPSFEDNSRVIYYGIEPASISARREKSPFSIIYTGRLIQNQKRILDFIPILNLLKKSGLSFQMTFVGDGPQGKELRTGLAPLIQSGHVRMLGRQPRQRVFEELSKHHAFVLFSDFEGLPLSLLEAMAHTCVPIVTDIKSGIQEVLVNEENALITPLNNHQAFVDAIIRLAEDTDLRKKLEENVIATLKRKRLFNDEMGKQYNEIIQQVFSEIENGEFSRPECLTFRSPNGEILIPPMLHQEF